jgi:tetratricopeptide (TPR) repeat protein
LRLALLLLIAVSPLLADDHAIADAVAALQRQDFAAAERLLRAEIAARPNDAMALSLLGVALDSQGKTQEAGPIHRRAVAAAPRNPDVLSNYGNHLAAAGDEDAARQRYLEAVAAAPSHVNANLQLIRIALQRKRPAEADGYLANLPDGVVDSRLCFSLGVALSEAGEFARAEQYFGRALAASPDDFNTLVNLGTVAASAGHLDRAREVFAAALRQQPANVDVLFRAAQVEYNQGHPDAGLKYLAPAARAAPDRADIQKLLAAATADVGAIEDSIAAWDRYIRLAPEDDAGRRERGFTLVRMGEIGKGAADLRWYLAKHPDDPVAHFQLGIADQDAAELDRAIALKPDFAEAYSARGGLLYQQGKPELALKDLETAARLRPDDPLTLDRLGQVYAALDRPKDAVPVLRRAAELAPGDSKTALHLARALADAGLPTESKAAMERFRQLGPAAKSGVPAGLVDYLALTPEQRKADYRARVEKAYRESPDDPTAQLHYLRLQLEDGKDSSAIARRLIGSKQAREAGIALVDAGQWALGKELLAGSDAPELAIADLHLLDNAGRIDEGAALAARAPATADVLWHASAILLRRGRSADALKLFDAARDSRELLLMKAAVQSGAGKSREADETLATVRSRWPEWPPASKPLAEVWLAPPRAW